MPYLDTDGLRRYTAGINERFTSLQQSLNQIDLTSGGTVDGNMSVTGSFTVDGKTIQQIAGDVVNNSVTQVLNTKY